MNLPSFISPLFVPANRPDRFEKAAASGADAIILDLEDAVSVEAKIEARSALRTDFTALPVLVRINGTGTLFHEDDLAAVRKLPIAAVMLPKAEVGASLDKIAASGLPVVALIETARGIAYAREIASMPFVVRLVFGSIDFSADMGCAHTREALLAARSELVLSSRLAGLEAPVDGVTTSIDDALLIASDARHARELGFGGKLAIHPRQIAAIREGFQPEASEVAWAQKVLASGDGATAIDGAMVDEPVRLRARAILKQAGRAGTA
ncbi:CoA ester lyase [Falsochrobactrum shanghaiense]|uniref:CoA ester lyase n=1 Tax=Falsochrobactrum shanghaiense TaxID=2201899 RepID=A0A316J8J1_9HYPH|nr:CoA ester lyase [Falsochrobactrum shanghaiense]PWL17621.1 CoA ester lyase [Falsochrobactrum shanghaiense]